MGAARAQSSRLEDTGWRWSCRLSNESQKIGTPRCLESFREMAQRAIPTIVRNSKQNCLRGAVRCLKICAMNNSTGRANAGRTCVAAFVSAAFLWTLLLSASPELHQRVHPDANQADHTCAVTLVASGNYDHAAQLPLISTPDFVGEFGSVQALTSTWVKPLFLNAHIFAHAPPALES
jgi:hypothetical protein